jgi:hypothetical protein
VLVFLLVLSESLAVLLVYSMALDGPVREQDSDGGFVAGSRALDSLDKLITSVESFFHPSNAGQWTLIVGSASASSPNHRIDYGTARLIPTTHYLRVQSSMV